MRAFTTVLLSFLQLQSILSCFVSRTCALFPLHGLLSSYLFNWLVVCLLDLSGIELKLSYFLTHNMSSMANGGLTWLFIYFVPPNHLPSSIGTLSQMCLLCIGKCKKHNHFYFWMPPSTWIASHCKHTLGLSSFSTVFSPSILLCVCSVLKCPCQLIFCKAQL